MKNSLIICQLYVAKAIQEVPKDVLVVHYMDDILLAGADEYQLHQAAQQLISALQQQGLHISP